MKKFVCSVCGYVHVGDAAPAECPLCHVGPEKFVEQKDGEMEWACEHVIGVAQGAETELKDVDIVRGEARFVSSTTIEVSAVGASKLVRSDFL